MQNDQFGMVTHMASGVFWEVSHAIAVAQNSLRALLVTAEFLVSFDSAHRLYNSASTNTLHCDMIVHAQQNKQSSKSLATDCSHVVYVFHTQAECVVRLCTKFEADWSIHSKVIRGS